jgi:predicted RNase H-like nuclease
MLHEAPERQNFQLPESGAVLGVDIGWDKKKKTTSVCLISWSNVSVSIEISPNILFKYSDQDDAKAVAKAAKKLANGKILSITAIDGMIMPDLSKAPKKYRYAEQCLSRGAFKKFGKPGQASSGNGQKLATQASIVAQELGRTLDLGTTTSLISGQIIEAFPNAFLATLLSDEELESAIQVIDAQTEIDAIKARIKKKKNPPSHEELVARKRIEELRAKFNLKADLVRSDFYYELLTASPQTNTLLQLIKRLIPGRNCHFDWGSCKDHDQRASLVCALTALCGAANQLSYVGDDTTGAIILPPRQNRRSRWTTRLGVHRNKFSEQLDRR